MKQVARKVTSFANITGFKANRKGKEDSKPIFLHATCFAQISCLAYLLALKWRQHVPLKHWSAFEWTTQHHIPEERTHNDYLNVQGNPCSYGA
jgi:hypothetical protein